MCFFWFLFFQFGRSSFVIFISKEKVYFSVNRTLKSECRYIYWKQFGKYFHWFTAFSLVVSDNFNWSVWLSSKTDQKALYRFDLWYAFNWRVLNLLLANTMCTENIHSLALSSLVFVKGFLLFESDWTFLKESKPGYQHYCKIYCTVQSEYALVVHLLLWDQILIWVKLFLNRNKKEKKRERDTNNERRKRDYFKKKNSSEKEGKEKSDKSTTMKVSCVTRW